VTGDAIEAVDLTAIEGAYNVSTTDGTPVWSLELAAPLPGVDGAYRGHTDCSAP